MSENITPDCEYQIIDNGIHEFIFHKASRSAVDFHISVVKTICENTTDDERRFILSDYSESGMLPIRYGMNSVRDLSKAGISLNNLTIAVVMNDNVMTQTFTTLVNTFARNVEIRFFAGGSHDDAVRWLQTEMQKIAVSG